MRPGQRVVPLMCPCFKDDIQGSEDTFEEFGLKIGLLVGFDYPVDSQGGKELLAYDRTG